MMALFLLALVAIAGGANSAAIGEDGNYGDSEWPAGISPLDSLSYWRNGEKATKADAKKPCCLPKLWTGRLFTEYRLEAPVGGVTYRYEHVVYFDQANKRLAGSVIVDNKTYVSHILLFNKTGATQYTFFRTTKKWCSKEFLPGAQIRQQCIPSNATLLRSFSLGAGRSTLRTQLWGYWYRDRRVDSAANLLVTPGDCIPVMSAFKTTSRAARTMDAEPPNKKTSELNIGTLFTDVKTNIVDQSVFKPPSFCKKREGEEEEKGEEEEEEEEEDKKLYFDHQDFHINALIESFVAVP